MSRIRFLILLIPILWICDVLVSAENKKWDDLVSDFIETYFRFNPDEAVDAGRHEFDGKLPDYSPLAIAKEISWLKELRSQAAGFEESELDANQRFERDYLIARINSRLFWLDKVKSWQRSPLAYSTSPSLYVSREYAPLPERMRAYIRYAGEVPRVIGQMKQNLQTPLPRTYVETAIGIYSGLAKYYRNDVPAVFASVKDEKLQSEFKEANEGAAAAADGLVAWLKDQLPEATNGYALGAELYREMLRDTEGVDITLERLEEVGRNDLERNLASLKKACAKLDPKLSVAECVKRVQDDKPAEDPVQEAKKQLAGLKKFIVDRKLVTIPGTEEADVDESPPYRRFNFAYIDIPGPFEKNLPSIYYIAPPDLAWTQEEQAEYIPGKAVLLDVTVHEVWPGHFLQYLHSKRSQIEIGRIFVGYAFSEGWAHYAEEMMIEAGLAENKPEIQIGQLLNALRRNVRYLSAIGLHTKGMTVEESEKMFRESAYLDPGNSRQQAYRGTFDPGYLNYTLGKLMIRKLREDWTATRGGREAWREFHDKFLSYGGPPIPLLRKEMLGREDRDIL